VTVSNGLEDCAVETERSGVITLDESSSVGPCL